MEVRQLTNNVKREYMNVHHCELEFDLSRPEYLTIVNFFHSLPLLHKMMLVSFVFLTQKISLPADAILKP